MQNARVAQDQEEYKKKYDSLVDRYNKTKETLDKVDAEIIEKETTAFTVNNFINDLENQDIITEFEKELWFDLIDYVVVYKDKKLKFIFKNGSEVIVN